MSGKLRKMQEYGDFLRFVGEPRTCRLRRLDSRRGCPYVGAAALKLLAPPRDIQYHKSISCHPMVWPWGHRLAKLFIQKG